MISARSKVGTIFVLVILVMLTAVVTCEAKESWHVIPEDMSIYQINEKLTKGWQLSFLPTSCSWEDPETPWEEKIIVNEPVKFRVWIRYELVRNIDGDMYEFTGLCLDEQVYLDIYKDDLIIDDHTGQIGSNGLINFSVTFKEPGYYGYKVYSEWEKEHGRIPERTEKFYVYPVPSPSPIPTASPSETQTPTPTPPGFEVIFAIAGLLAVAYIVRRGG